MGLIFGCAITHPFLSSVQQKKLMKVRPTGLQTENMLHFCAVILILQMDGIFVHGTTQDGIAKQVKYALLT